MGKCELDFLDVSQLMGALKSLCRISRVEGSMEPIHNSSKPPTFELKELKSTENGEVSEVLVFSLFFRTHRFAVVLHSSKAF